MYMIGETVRVFTNFDAEKQNNTMLRVSDILTNMINEVDTKNISLRSFRYRIRE